MKRAILFLVQRQSCLKRATSPSPDGIEGIDSRGASTLIINKVMKRKVLYLVTASLSLSLLIAGGMGQQPKPQKTNTSAEQSQEKPEVINVRRVRLPITVIDKKNQFVSGLTEGDFFI